jgi:S-adenosyl methyltransferase
MAAMRHAGPARHIDRRTPRGELGAGRARFRVGCRGCVHNQTCNDPIVHVHANALLTGSGSTSIVLADLRDPEAILADPKLRGLIDFSQPVALLLVAILHFVTEAEDPARIVATLRDALPPGSYLVLSHGTADFHPPGVAGQAAGGYEHATAPLVLRGFGQVSAFFDGFDLVEPGLVQAPLWRPDGRPPRPKDLAKIGIYAGVGCKA